MLRQLAAAFPQHAPELAAVQARLFDLLRVVRRSCYHRDFHGSFSLKAVLPALVPHLGHEPQEGLQAIGYSLAITCSANARA